MTQNKNINVKYVYKRLRRTTKNIRHCERVNLSPLIIAYFKLLLINTI